MMQPQHKPHVTRRGMIAGGTAAIASGGVLTGKGRAVETAAPITIVINQSPWFDSFRRTVAEYEKRSGNKVNLDVNPFAGSLEKQRQSVRSVHGQYDLLVMNSGWFAEMYFGEFVEPLTDIDPSFKLERDVYTLDDTVYFDAAKKVMAASGKLMSMPIAPLIPLLYYREDLYKSTGLKVPQTFAELEANAIKLNHPPHIYGIVQRGARGTASVSYDFYPYLYGFGGNVFKDPGAGDYQVTLNSTAGRTALEYYLRLAKEAGHPRTASIDQAEVILNMVTGKAAHIMVVAAAWSQMDNPDKSAVVGKVDFAPPPHARGFPTAPGLGHWLGGVSRNVPDARKRATVEFLNWFQTRDAQMFYARAGGIPISSAIYNSPLAAEPRFRWMKAMAEALPHAVNIYYFPQASEVTGILDVGLNRAVAGEITAVAALNSMADQIYHVMASNGYRTGVL
ncbi:MAG TPA: extracellular solute-binding protein [Acetobacteraceae bacterium]|nr:extracellular solute-binding protein [Acetobacteraceae bacterium]